MLIRVTLFSQPLRHAALFSARYADILMIAAAAPHAAAAWRYALHADDAAATSPRCHRYYLPPQPCRYAMMPCCRYYADAADMMLLSHSLYAVTGVAR